MLRSSDLDQATPAELSALAGLAIAPDLLHPPHIRRNLEAKGWVMRGADGVVRLTDRGRHLVELN